MNESDLADRFLGASPATLVAIREYQKKRDPALVPAIVHGIVAKYLPAAARAGYDAGTRPLSAFGLESLTLMEVILDIQDALGLSLTEQELRALSHLEEATALLEQKVAALSSPNESK